MIFSKITGSNVNVLKTGTSSATRKDCLLLKHATPMPLLEAKRGNLKKAYRSLRLKRFLQLRMTTLRVNECIKSRCLPPGCSRSFPSHMPTKILQQPKQNHYLLTNKDLRSLLLQRSYQTNTKRKSRWLKNGMSRFAAWEPVTSVDPLWL